MSALVPSRHCALPQPKTENDTIDTLRMCIARGCCNVQAHTKIKFLLNAFQPFIRKFALTKSLQRHIMSF